MSGIYINYVVQANIVIIYYTKNILQLCDISYKTHCYPVLKINK